MSFSADETWMDFIDMVTDPCNTNEIFKIETVQSYITYWSTQPQPPECSVCCFALGTHRSRDEVTSKTRVFLKQISSFAEKMPENIIGVALTWLYMKYKGMEILNEEDALQLDPMSVLFHTIVGCCDEAFPLNYSDTNLKLLLSLKTMTKKSKSHTESQTPKSTRGIRKKSREGKFRYQRQCGKTKREEKILTDFVRDYIHITHQARDHHVNCIYKNSGEIDNVVDFQTSINDCRIYVSEKWVDEVMGVSYYDFNSARSFMRYHSGIFQPQTKQNTHGGEADREHFVSRGFAQMDQCMYHNVSMECGVLRKEHLEETQKIVDRAKYFVELMNTVPSILGKKSPIYSMNKSFPVCKWCVFSIDKRLRYVINDLYVMCRHRMQEVGLGCECLTMDCAWGGSKSSQNPLPKYSLGLSKNSVSVLALKAVFDEWSEEKYPFIKSTLLSDDVTSDLQAILCHQDPKKGIYCAGNRRRCFTETKSTHQKRTHKCFIIYVIKILQTLLQNGVKLAKESDKIRKIAALHDIMI